MTLGQAPAFPHSEPHALWPGMTMREWYAGMAMQGLLAGPWVTTEDAKGVEQIPQLAFLMADQMLAEAAKKSG